MKSPREWILPVALSLASILLTSLVLAEVHSHLAAFHVWSDPEDLALVYLLPTIFIAAFFGSTIAATSSFASGLVVHASNVLNDAVADIIPDVDAEGEVRLGLHRQVPTRLVLARWCLYPAVKPPAGWLHEIKHDGFRTLVRREMGSAASRCLMRQLHSICLLAFCASETQLQATSPACVLIVVRP